MSFPSSRSLHFSQWAQLRLKLRGYFFPRDFVKTNGRIALPILLLEDHDSPTIRVLLRYPPCLVRVVKTVKVMMNQGIASLMITLILAIAGAAIATIAIGIISYRETCRKVTSQSFWLHCRQHFFSVMDVSDSQHTCM